MSDLLLHGIASLLDDIASWGVPEGKRCRSIGFAIDILLDKQYPTWLRDTACHALACVAPDDYEAVRAIKAVQNEPNNVGKLAKKFIEAIKASPEYLEANSEEDVEKTCSGCYCCKGSGYFSGDELRAETNYWRHKVWQRDTPDK